MIIYDDAAFAARQGAGFSVSSASGDRLRWVAVPLPVALD
jgi:hypothetical protein